MLVDTSPIPSGGVLEAEVCVVGCGPAGITLGRELEAAGIDTILLEAGDLGSHREQDRYLRGESIGHPMYMTRSRARGFGGSSLRWLPSTGLRARPLDAIDFEWRPSIRDSGWPFGQSELDPYYERAHAYAGLGPYEYDLAAWERADAAAFDFGDDVATRIFQFGPHDQWSSQHHALATARHLRLLTSVALLEIRTTEQPDVVSSVRVQGPHGRQFEVHAQRFVLALGGLENARMLLLSDQRHPGGMGNEHDLVGRYFMEHLSYDTGVIVPFDRSSFKRADLYVQRHEVDGTPVQGMLALESSVVRREGLRNAAFWIEGSYPERARPTALSARALISAIPRRPLAAHAAEHIRNVVRDPVTLARVGYWETVGEKPAPTIYRMRVLAEQAPNAASRVMLTAARDDHGLRQLQVDWRIDDDDLYSIRRTQDLVDASIHRSGFGRLRQRLGEERPPATMIGNSHHMGTTRMHKDPAHGVVDPDCRVHSVRNLFISGSSVFPTGGYANPTLTIVALAVRLADHLRGDARR